MVNSSDLSFGNPMKGQPLPPRLAVELERFFGTDLSSVRLHTDGLAGELDANAVTHGTDIYFAPGKYDPDSSSGRALIAHELAHVVQQLDGRASAKSSSSGGLTLVCDPELEADADRASEELSRGVCERAARCSSRAADQESVDWSILLPNLKIQPVGAAATKLTSTSNAMTELGNALRGTPYYYDFSFNRTSIETVLKAWINSSSNSYKRFLKSQREGTRVYQNWVNLGRALIGEARSMGNLERENDLARQTIESDFINTFLGTYLAKLERELYKPANVVHPLVQIIRSKTKTYKGEYKHWYGSMKAILKLPRKYSFKNKVAVIHDLNKVFARIDGARYQRVPDDKTEMTYLVPDGFGGFQNQQERQNGTGGFRRGQPARGMGVNRPCTLIEDSEVIKAARHNNMPLSLGPSFTTGRMMQLAHAVNASLNEKTSVAWGIFAFWNSIYSQKFSRIHRFHGTMDAAKNYDVPYNPFHYPNNCPSYSFDGRG